MKIKSMKAAIMVDQNQPLVIDKVQLPDKLDFGQVLIDVKYSGICGSQIGEIKGVKGPDKFLPHLLGHEGSGVVLETGEGVKKVNVGDHVVMHWRKGYGIDSNTPKYKWNNQILNAGSITTFNEYSIVSENRITRIDKSFPLDFAPLYGCAITTGFGVIENNAKLKMGNSILIIGSGGVGLNIIQAACLYNAYPVVAIDMHKNRLSLAKKLGATHTIISDGTQGWKKELDKIFPNDKFDFVVDNTGSAKIISLAYELTSDQGKTVLVGVPKKDDMAKLYTLPIHFGKKIVGSHGGNGHPDRDIYRYINLEKLGKFDSSKIVSNFYNLDNINVAIESMISGEVEGRCIIKC